MKRYVVLLFLGVFLLTTGFLDNEWMIHHYRFTAWFREIDYWIYTPYIIFFWWDAYVFNVVRLIVGSGLIGYLVRVLEKMRENK